MTKTLPYLLLRRTSGWYEKPVPEALSFLLLFTNSSELRYQVVCDFHFGRFLYVQLGTFNFQRMKRKKKETNQHFLQSLVPGRQAA